MPKKYFVCYQFIQYQYSTAEPSIARELTLQRNQQIYTYIFIFVIIVEKIIDTDRILLQKKEKTKTIKSKHSETQLKTQFVFFAHIPLLFYVFSLTFHHKI